MQKFVLILAIGILTFSLGGCGSPEEAEETETIEETAPSEIEGDAEPDEEGEDEEDEDEEGEDEEDEDEDD